MNSNKKTNTVGGRTSDSDWNTSNSSPACGTLLSPVICTAMEGPASRTSPVGLRIVRTCASQPGGRESVGEGGGSAMRVAEGQRQAGRKGGATVGYVGKGIIRYQRRWQ
jgi:hypothetical protein